MPAAPPSGRRDELMAGSHTVFEFTGSEAGREHRGSRGTFMGATLDLSNAKEERETALRSGPGSWIFGGVALLLVAGITAYMVMGRSDTEPGETTAAVAAPDATKPAPETKAEAGSGDASAGDETAGGSGEPAADAKAPADDAKAIPAAEAPKPTEPAVAPPTEPKPASKPASKPSGTTKPKPKPSAPKEEPKPSGGKQLKPKKPPRDPLGNLPPPPG